MAIALSTVQHLVVPVRSTQMLSETFGERLSRLRERSRMTQAQLAEAAGDGVSEAWIAAAEKDRIKNPASEKGRIREIARALGFESSRYLTEPLGIVFIEDEAPYPDALASIEATIISEPTLSDERKQAGLVVMRDLFARSKEQAS